MRGGKLLVLVVERDPHVRELEAHFLSRAGFEVQFANDGKAALAQARSLRPDLVITEILVPQLDGLALCRQLKADPQTADISVLVFSILASRARAIEAGADAFLMKPLAEHRLVRTVEELLEKRDRLQRVIDELELAHPGRSILLQSDRPVSGDWDPDRLAQALSNVMANALQHGDRSKPVRVSIGSADGAITIDVHNEGTPIPPELMPRLFDPFRRAALDRGALPHGAGLGLGLFIAQQIFQAHGGKIAVTSTVESGTVVSIRLPQPIPTHRVESSRAVLERNYRENREIGEENQSQEDQKGREERGAPQRRRSLRV